MVSKTKEDQLKTLDHVMEAMQGWNGLDNPAESKSVTITFDTHEQARQFARNFGHLLWLSWAIEEAAKMQAAHGSEEGEFNG